MSEDMKKAQDTELEADSEVSKSEGDPFGKIINKAALEKKTGLNKTSIILFGLAVALFLAAVLVYLIGGKTDDSRYLTLLQEQTPSRYAGQTDLTYGTGFEKFFDNGEWSYDSDTKIATFTGDAVIDFVSSETSHCEISFTLKSSNGVFTSTFSSFKINGSDRENAVYLKLEKLIFGKESSTGSSQADS